MLPTFLSNRQQNWKDYLNNMAEVSSAKIILDKFLQRSRGFGFVEMADDSAFAQQAISSLNGQDFMGKILG